jgi:hypothetical protein
MRPVDNDNVVLAVDDLDSEGAVLNRRRLLEDEQAPLLRQEQWETAEDLDALPWYKRPSVGKY